MASSSLRCSAARRGDYFDGPQLGGPRLGGISRSPTASERASDSSATRQPKIPRTGCISIIKFCAGFFNLPCLGQPSPATIDAVRLVPRATHACPGQLPLWVHFKGLPHRNSNGRFTSINGHSVPAPQIRPSSSRSPEAQPRSMDSPQWRAESLLWC